MTDLHWEALDSSNVHSAAYDADGAKLHVRFHGGGRYIYHGVPQDVYEGLMSAGSAGSYLNQNIAGTYRYDRA